MSSCFGILAVITSAWPSLLCVCGVLTVQVHELTAKLASCELQLQLAAEDRAEAQAEVAALQASLLQQTPISEAVQGQLAAAAITQQAHALLAPPAEVQQPGASGGSDAAAAEHASLCAGLAAAVQMQLAASPLPATDPKVQRIQELRAALAAALAGSAAPGATTQGALLATPAAAAAAGTSGKDAPGSLALHLLGGPLASSSSTTALAEDPKAQRLTEVVQALMAAATQLPTAGLQSWDAGTAVQHDSTSSSSSLAMGDAKQQRIQELRAALSEALRERDELRQRLQELAPEHTNRTLVESGQQLQETLAVQVCVCVCAMLTAWDGHASSIEHPGDVFVVLGRR